MEPRSDKKPDGRLFDEIKLDNGLTLYFYDLSRPIVGDRSQVQLVLHVPVDVGECFFDGYPDPKETFAAFTADVGEGICFRQEKVRNFIDSDKALELLGKMKKELLDSNLGYLSKPQFAEKYARKRIADWEKNRQWRKAYFEHGAAGVHES